MLEQIWPYLLQGCFTLAMGYLTWRQTQTQKRWEREQEAREAEARAAAEKQAAMYKGMRALLRQMIRQRAAECIERGYCTADDRDDLAAWYEPYHALGGNSTTTDLKKRAESLPLTAKN